MKEKKTKFSFNVFYNWLKKISDILIEKYGAITTVSIDRQTTRNSLDILTLQQLTEALNAFDQDAEAKVLVIAGEGGTFCSGFDMDELEEKGYNNMTDAAVSHAKQKHFFFYFKFVNEQLLYDCML